MAAFGQSTALLLGAAFLIACVAAAPAPAAEGDSAQTQALDYPNEAGASRCYYNFQHYEEGDRIVTNEPCLNCTCHKRMLMCYLRVCPFTKPLGQDCTVEKRPDQCCPVITCPQVPVDVLTSSTTTTEASASTAVGHPSTFGCTLEDNTFYPDGVQMPSDSKKPCELCYCIRNHTACVRQECTLNVEGCRPIYQEGVCCPVRYDCEYNELTTTTERPSTGGLLLSSTASPLQCRYGETVYNDGELIESDKPCESCYCMRGDIVCAVRSCGEPMAGKDCEALPPPEGECCPTAYQCANGTVPVDNSMTESTMIMHPSDIQTQSPPQESQSESSTEEASKPNEPQTEANEPESVPEVVTDAPKEEEKEPEKVEDVKAEEETPDTLPEHVESHPLDAGEETPETLPEHVESDPLDAEELEEDEALSANVPVDDTKPDQTNAASDSSSDQTSTPVKETEHHEEHDTNTAEPVKVEPEESTELYTKPSSPDSSEPGKVTSDSEVPAEHVDPEHVRDDQKEEETEVPAEPQVVKDETPVESVSGGEPLVEAQEPEKQPEETNDTVPQETGNAVSEPETSDSADVKPAEASSDEVSQPVESENELKPQEESSNTHADEVPQEETAANIPESPESLDQIKESDLIVPTKDAIPTGEESKPLEQTDEDVEHEPTESSEILKPEGGEPVEESPTPSLNVESEGVQKEPVPPRKEDAAPEEPHPTQHAEGSMTKAEDSIPTDLSQTHSETDVPDKTEEVDEQGNESQSEIEIKPTESLQAETLIPTKEGEQEHSSLDMNASQPAVSSDNVESPEEIPQHPDISNAVESESSTAKVDQPAPPTEAQVPNSSDQESVPNVVVTENEAESPAESVPEVDAQYGTENPISENSHDEEIKEPSPVEPETPVTDVESVSDEHPTPAESSDVGKPAETTNEKHDEESKKPETSNATNDESIVFADNESSTKENEVVEHPEEQSSSVKDQIPNASEDTSTDEHKPVDDEKEQNEINEITPEHSDVKPDEIVTEHESHTESAPSEENSTDTLVKLGSGDKPEGTEAEKETVESTDSKPAESQPSESENVQHTDNTESNVYPDVVHDPVELDPTDFEDQQLEDGDHHIHNEISSENEIIDDHHPGHGGLVDHKHPVHVPGPVGVIPGEGDCLVDGKTYTNNSEIPSRSPCHKLCTCMSSIVHCLGIDCPPPPPQLANCMPVHQGDLCCPVYTCDGNTPDSPETDNQVVATDGTLQPTEPEQKPETPEKTHEEVSTEPAGSATNEEESPSTEASQPVVENAEQHAEESSQPIVENAEQHPEETTQSAVENAEESTQSAVENAEQHPEENSQSVVENAEQHPEESSQSVVENAEQHPEESTQSAVENAEQHSEESTQSAVENAEQHPEENSQSVVENSEQQPEESSQSSVENAEQHPEESTQPQTSEVENGGQEPLSPESEASSNAEETPQSSSEDSHVEESVPVTTEGVESDVVNSENKIPAEENVEPEAQTEAPISSDAVEDNKPEETPESDANALPSEGVNESQPAVPAHDGVNEESEHEYPSTDSPTVEEEVQPQSVEGTTLPEVEVNSNASVEEEHHADVPEEVAVGEVEQSLAENHVVVTESPIEKPTESDTVSAAVEQNQVSEGNKDSVQTPVEETVESHDKPSQSSDDVQETPDVPLDSSDNSSVQEAVHETMEEETHTEGSVLSETDVSKKPEESEEGVTDLPIKDNTSLESDDTNNLLHHQPQSPEGSVISPSSDDISKHETETHSAHEVEESSGTEGPSEISNNLESEQPPVEASNEVLPGIENAPESGEYQTDKPSIPEENKPVEDALVSQAVHDPESDGDQEGETPETGTELSHEVEVPETSSTEDHQLEGSETGKPVQEGEPESILEHESTETPAADIVHAEHDGVEEALPPNEVQTDSSLESEKLPSPDSPSSEYELSTQEPEAVEEQATTVIYKEHEGSVESDEKLSESHEAEPISEHQEPTVDDHSDETAPIVESEESSSAQPLVPENEESVVPEVTEHPVSESEKPIEETEHHSEATSDSPEPSEAAHEIEHPSVEGTAESQSGTEVEAVPEKDSEEAAQPEQEENVPVEDHLPTEGSTETYHEEVKPSVEDVHKEPNPHVEEPSGSEQTHSEEEHLTKPEESQQGSENLIHEPESPVQETEHPTHEAELQESILPHLPSESIDEDLKPSSPIDPDLPTEDQFPTGAGDMDYDVNEDGAFGPGTCRYGGKVYVSAQQIPRDDPCDFCFCFRSDIICLQQSCPPPIHRCHQEPIQGYCCPRYQCPVSMATSLNVTTTTTTTTTTLPPHFFAHAYHGAARQAGCLHKGRAYSVGEEITSASGPCLQCICGSDGQMKCDPVVCSPEPMLRKMMEAAVSHRRR